MNFKGKSIVLVIITMLSVWLGACTEDVFVKPKVFGRITGTVIDNETKKPLNAVLIKLNPSGRSLQTDTTGTFAFDSLIAGKYTISAEKEGLYNEYVSVEVTEDQNPVATIYMSIDLKNNRPPTKPTKPIPAVGNAVTGVNNVLLSWTASDPDRDTLRYDVYLFKSGTSPGAPYITNFNNDTLIVNNLEYDKTYYWQVVAKDKSESVFSEIWSFTTPKFPSQDYVFAREEGERYQIYAANNDQTVVKLTTEGSNWRPIVSPNREQIAFISNRSTNPQIYIMNRDGSAMRKVTTIPVSGLSALDLSFCFAENGSKIIYPSNNKLYSINIDGTGLVQVAQAQNGRQFAGCDWNEATRRIIARTTGQNIYENEFVLINGSEVNTVFGSSTRTSNPVFSIEGDKVLFSRDISNFRSEEGRQLDARLFMLTLADRSILDISKLGSSSSTDTDKPTGTNDLDPRFSPTGRNILFTNTNNDGISIRRLFTVDITGRGRTRVLDNAEMGYWRQQQ